MKFQNPSMNGSCRTDGCTNGQPKTNTPRQLLRNWGHNDPYIIKACSYESAEQQTSNNIRVDINCSQMDERTNKLTKNHMFIPHLAKSSCNKNIKASIYRERKLNSSFFAFTREIG